VLFESPSVERLVESFRRLPGIGKRTAERLALHVLTAPAEDAEAFSHAIADARRCITRCSVCRVLTETDPCAICASDRREPTVLCVVERTEAVIAIEKGGVFRGRYHVLNGALSPLDGIGPSELGWDALRARIDRDRVGEVIVATNTTSEGEATALFIAQQLADRGIQVTRIAHGVPVGGGLEYADDATLAQAITGRTKL